MNIYIVGPANPYRGGIAMLNEVLAQNFRDQGHQVTIVNFTLQYPSFLFPGKSQYTAAAPPSGISIVRLVNSIWPLSWIKAAREIRRAKPDMVIVRYWMPFMAPALGSVARLSKAKVIALTDNIIAHEPRFYDRICTQYFLNSVHGVVYMSAQVGEELRSFNFRGVSAFTPHPIYNTYGEVVDRQQALTHLGLDPQFRYLLFFGFIRTYKGLDLLLEALPKLRTEGVKLIIAGEYYNNQAAYETQIDRLGIRDMIVMRDDYIPESEVRYYFSAADIVVQPYKTATQSGVTQIAYHFGTPMIVTRVGGLAEIVPDGKVGYVVEQTPDQIAEAIDRFYFENRAQEFRRAIAVEKERFSWSRMTETFYNLNSK